MLRVNFVRTEILVFDAVRKPLFEGLMPIAKNGARDWSAFSDQQLVSHAQKLIGERVITGRKELAKADNGLYRALQNRKLIDWVGLKNLNVGDRNWASMNDEELVGFARKFVEERRISGRSGLVKADEGLYNALWKRKLIDRVGLEKKVRDWASMNDEELVGFARKFVGEREITGRAELKKADSGLYTTLGKRKLIDAVFVPIEQKKKDELFSRLSEAVDAYTKIE